MDSQSNRPEALLLLTPLRPAIAIATRDKQSQPQAIQALFTSLAIQAIFASLSEVECHSQYEVYG